MEGWKGNWQRSVYERNKKRERLIQPDTYKVKAEGEMHTHRDTKRQTERRTETVNEAAGRKRREWSSIWVMTHTDKREREQDIHIFFMISLMHSNCIWTLACNAFEITFMPEKHTELNWIILILADGQRCDSPGVCTQTVSRNRRLLPMCCSTGCAQICVFMNAFRCLFPHLNECVSVC